MAEWLRRLTRRPKVKTAVGSNPALDSLVTVRNSIPGRPEPCEGNLVAAAGSCGGLMVKHPWPLLEISLSEFRRLATLNLNTYLPTWCQPKKPFTASTEESGSNLALFSYIYAQRLIFIHLFSDVGVCTHSKILRNVSNVSKYRSISIFCSTAKVFLRLISRSELSDQ